jgi:hypothetical protein
MRADALRTRLQRGPRRNPRGVQAYSLAASCDAVTGNREYPYGGARQEQVSQIRKLERPSSVPGGRNVAFPVQQVDCPGADF